MLRAMSVEAVESLLKEVRKDVGLAAMLGADPSHLKEYDLEPKEVAALVDQDPDALREMGVDAELAENARLIGRMTG
jgi:hypothetical protein